MKNIFVIGLTDFQRRELESLPRAADYQFHGLLDPSIAVSGRHSFYGLLDQAREELSRHSYRPDAIIAHWDFPTSVLVPILSREYDIPSPSLESVFKCEHKYWSRMEQSKCIPGCAPKFSGFDPFDEDPLSQVEIDFPFWVKPIKTFSSQLGFRIENAEEFRRAVEIIRKKVRLLGDTFDEALTMIELPDEIKWTNGHTCIVEEIIEGIQAAPEGSVFEGQFNVHGVIDMPKDEKTNSIGSLVYPSSLPEEVQQKMINASREFLAHIGFDNGCFNTEFMWDQARDKLLLIEANTRISQAHSDLFIKVNGESNHQVAIDVALGRKPEMPAQAGHYQLAAKCMLRQTEDAVVTSVPKGEDLHKLHQHQPDAYVEWEVEQGTRLSDLPNQGSYCFVYGHVYLGADSREELDHNFNECLEILPFEFAQQPPSAPDSRQDSHAP